MQNNTTTFALVTLVVLLCALGAMTNSVPVLTMAASSLTGLFAWLQVRPKE